MRKTIRNLCSHKPRSTTRRDDLCVECGVRQPTGGRLRCNVCAPRKSAAKKQNGLEMTDEKGMG